MRASRPSPAKVNLLLNVLGRRPDGFHELETVLLPLSTISDELTVERRGVGITLTCDHPGLPTDSGNLVYRAAKAYLDRAGIAEGVAIHLEKRMPLESGLGGGSSNAATMLLLLEEVFGAPLGAAVVGEIAAGLGSDVPFFLEPGPALATGRGEQIERLEPFRALEGAWILLVYPGFGVSTPWAYQQLKHFPKAMRGEAGRARRLLDRMGGTDARAAGLEFYNALEGPVHTKYPILMMFQEGLRRGDSLGVLMSGSGSTTFSLWPNEAAGGMAREDFAREFGDTYWTALAAL